METENLISIHQFCDHHKIEHTLIFSLNEHDLVQLILLDNVAYIHFDEIPILEKIIRLHFDLSINFEGIGVIIQLLNKNERLEEELTRLRQKLEILEH